jgi:hypothetical protein
MDVDLNGDCSSGGDGQQPPSGGGGGGGPPDLTADLLQRFSCMNTTDKDVLVEQLKRLLGEHINDESAVFWLDMNNWSVVLATRWPLFWPFFTEKCLIFRHFLHFFNVF